MEGFLLNEQTWLQHLKEKRLAYGLSQNRLAVATGITRQYLSDIETGKVKPSEDLQQSLWEALERFNPDAPLEMLFDYVRIRFPTTDVQQVVENILQLKLSYFLHEDYGFYSYSEHYALGDIFVLCSHELDKGVLVELKGRGCRQFESYLLAQQRSWYEFFMDVLVAGGVMKRLDLAINDKTGILNILYSLKSANRKNVSPSSAVLKAIAVANWYAKRKRNVWETPSISVHYKVKFISVSMKRTTSSTRKMIFPLKTQK